VDHVGTLGCIVWVLLVGFHVGVSGVRVEGLGVSLYLCVKEWEWITLVLLGAFLVGLRGFRLWGLGFRVDRVGYTDV